MSQGSAFQLLGELCRDAVMQAVSIEDLYERIAKAEQETGVKLSGHLMDTATNHFNQRNKDELIELSKKKVRK